jgi:hypothetical protein
MGAQRSLGASFDSLVQGSSPVQGEVLEEEEELEIERESSDFDDDIVEVFK